MMVYALLNEFADGDGYDAHKLVGIYSTHEKATAEADRLRAIPYRDAPFQVVALKVYPITLDGQSELSE